MYVDAITVAPVDFDFSKGYGETWDIVYPSVNRWTLKECYDYLTDKGCDLPDPNPWDMEREELVELLNSISIECYDEESDETLREAVIANISDETLEGLDEWRETVEEILVDYSDEYTPMMNYYYPLPNFRMDYGKAQSILQKEGGAVALVTVNDEPVLALTGGGMDLSWDICHAYMLLNYYPPFHFTDLPRFAGMESDEKTQKVLDAAIQSAEILHRWATQRIDSLLQYKNHLLLDQTRA